MTRLCGAKLLLPAIALGAAALLGGCVAYPAYPTYGYGYGYPGPYYGGSAVVVGGGWRGGGGGYYGGYHGGGYYR